jgi:hypothetical protein
VPSKERLRRDHERCLPISGECPARRGKEGPIPVVKLRPTDRAAEHFHLVAKHGVLELELRGAPASGEQPDEANEHEVDEGSHGARMLPTGVNRARNRVLEPDRHESKRSTSLSVPSAV